MNRYLALSLVLLFAAGALFAQTAAGTTQTGPNAGTTVLVNTAKGLFVLRSGVLAKYDAATLTQSKKLQLFGAVPTAPTDRADTDGWTKYYTDMAQRTAPALLIPKDNYLLLVIGDHFARINQDTLKVETTGDLTPVVKPADTTTGANGGGRNMFGGMRQEAPGYLLTGSTLFLMRSTELLSVDVDSGKVAHSTLQSDLQPLQMANPYGNGGRPPRGGGAGGPGGGRGNRGGGGGGNGAAGGAAGGAAPGN